MDTTDPRRWYEKPLIIIPATLLAAILLAGIFFGGQTTDAPVGLDTQEQPDDDNHVDVEPEREFDAGDWPSEEAYLEDLIDSLDSVNEILRVMSDATNDFANGRMSEAEYLALNDTFRQVLASHRDHFAGTTPPAGYESAHKNILKAWDLHDEASRLLDRGVRTQDNAVLSEAQDTMRDAQQLLQKALNDFPTGALA